jgi:hypothetical protein
MKRKWYTEEQIISILKEHEAGASVPEIARRHSAASRGPESARIRFPKSATAAWPPPNGRVKSLRGPTLIPLSRPIIVCALDRAAKVVHG